MAIIQDGGNANPAAQTSLDGRLNVSSRSDSRAYYNSRDLEQTYFWTSSYSATTGDEIIYIKNTSPTLNLYIKSVVVGGVLTGLFEVIHVHDGTATGTTITGKNPNLTSGNAAAATAFGNAAVTGTLTGERIAIIRTIATDSLSIEIHDTLILGQNDEIAVTYTGGTSIVNVEIVVFFDIE